MTSSTASTGAPPSRLRPGTLLLAASLVLLVGGGIASLQDGTTAAAVAWGVAGGIGAIAAAVDVVKGLLARAGGVDILALIALVGALATSEFLAAALVTVMLASGRFLDEMAEARARRELTLLANRAPARAALVTPAGVVEVDVDTIRPGDEVMVGTGSVVPVDGRTSDRAEFDESALTGEAMPVTRPAGDRVRSGVVNVGRPVTVIATATAGESTYAGVVRLVESAQADQAPFVRLADRMAVWFVPLSLGLAAIAWMIHGTATAAVSVLVVATPCPLLLAVPIAVMSGVSQCARRGVVVKGGVALERLAAGRVLLFDKTGTLTQGRPALTQVITAPGVDRTGLVTIAASLDQMSPHVLATSVVAGARAEGLPLTWPTDVREVHGQGVEGRVGDHMVRIGRGDWVLTGMSPDWARRARRRADLEGCLLAFVAVDGVASGALLFSDQLRPDAPRMIRTLRAVGVHRVVLVSGDRADLAMSVGRLVGVDQVYADCAPEDKVRVVGSESERGASIMVGDGINDAPALAAAGVGVALAARGATASSEAADVVLTVDRVDRLADAILLARRAQSVARQAAMLGMGLSFVAMAAALAGYLPPAVGALAQEVIDVVAILWALRAGLPHQAHTIPVAAVDADTLQRIAVDHQQVAPLVEEIREVADALDDTETAADPLLAVRALLDKLETRLLPHERMEEAELLPAVARTLGGLDPVGALSRSHAEIEHLVAQLARLVNETGVDPHDLVSDLRRTLYRLYGVLRLHNAQEEEGIFALVGHQHDDHGASHAHG